MAPKKARLPQDLVAARARFDAWRATCSGGRRRYPQELWDIALPLARKHGVNGTAKALGVTYRSLQRQIEAAPETRETESPLTFVQVSPSIEPSSRSTSPTSSSTERSASRSDCVVEFEDPRGTRITIRTSDLRDVDLASLVTVLLGKRRVSNLVKSFFGRRG